MDFSKLRDLTDERTSPSFADDVNHSLGVLGTGSLVQPIPGLAGGPWLTPLEILLGLGDATTVRVGGRTPGYSQLHRWWPVLRHIGTFDRLTRDSRLRLSAAARQLKRRAKSARNEDLAIGVAAALWRRGSWSGDLLDVDAHHIELVDTTGRRPDYLAIDVAGRVHAVIECKGSESSARQQCVDATDQLLSTRLAPGLSWASRVHRLILGQEARGGYVSAIALQLDSSEGFLRSAVRIEEGRAPERLTSALRPDAGPSEIVESRLLWAGDTGVAGPERRFRTSSGLELVGSELQVPGGHGTLRVRFGLMRNVYEELREAPPGLGRSRERGRWERRDARSERAAAALERSRTAGFNELRRRGLLDAEPLDEEYRRGRRDSVATAYDDEDVEYAVLANGMALGVSEA